MASDPHSRIYWRVLSDPKFADVVADPALFGTWALLLLVADMAFPQPPFVPPVIAQDDKIDDLCDVGLVERVGTNQYRIHGLAAERERRSSSGRHAAAVRWQSDRNADA